MQRIGLAGSMKTKILNAATGRKTARNEESTESIGHNNPDGFDSGWRVDLGNPDTVRPEFFNVPGKFVFA
jgi:hypothetical protein